MGWRFTNGMWTTDNKSYLKERTHIHCPNCKKIVPGMTKWTMYPTSTIAREGTHQCGEKLRVTKG